MIVRLLDVNVLLSILDPKHIHHNRSVKWFRTAAAKEGWATTALTENGFIRVISQIGYPNIQMSPALAAELLRRFKTAFPQSYRFWADAVSLTDTSLFDLSGLTGPRQTTHVYLAGLAFKNGGRLATLDEGINWRAIRGADSNLLEQIPT